jgi:hypothetical protein
MGYYTTPGHDYLNVDTLKVILQKALVWREKSIRNGYNVDKLSKKIVRLKEDIRNR